MFTVCTLRKESGAFATVAEGLTRAQASALRSSIHRDMPGYWTMLYRDDGRFINSRDK